MATMDESILTNGSLDKDGHESAIRDSPSCSVNPDVLNRLRLDILKLVCEVTCKYQSVRKITPMEENKCNCSAQCNCTTNKSPNCDTDWEEESIDSTCTSTSFDSTGSGNSDSTFHVTSEDEDEPDDSQDMYNVESNHEYPCQNMPSPQEIDETDDMSDGDDSDDDDVEEMYSDFNIDSIGQFRDVDYCDNDNINNLVCPGDVLEYCTIEDDQTARRSSVNTIIESGTDAYIVLEDGVMLRPNKHSVRKIKFYDGFNQELIPNPLAEWHRLDKCILQSVITVNLICTGDTVEYCSIDGDQTARRSSVNAIVDSESDAYVILKNGSILRQKKHLIRKVDLFDEIKQELILNHVLDWHRLDTCILKSGSVAHDNCVEAEETEELTDADVSRARAERRRQNKQT